MYSDIFIGKMNRNGSPVVDIEFSS